jgi:hypothetical protein
MNADKRKRSAWLAWRPPALLSERGTLPHTVQGVPLFLCILYDKIETMQAQCQGAAFERPFVFYGISPMAQLSLAW